MSQSAIRHELTRCGQSLAQKGLVWGHSGNISAKIDSGRFVISPGGVNLGNLFEDDLLLCHIEDDLTEGGATPSMETGLHRGIYRQCTEARAVIHSQPFHTTVVACSSFDIRTDVLPEAMAYLGTVERVPYHHAGSTALAEAAAAMARGCRALILDNHGAICWGESLDEALLLTEALEFLCRLLVMSHGNGIELNYLGQETLQDFRRHLRGIGRLR